MGGIHTSTLRKLSFISLIAFAFCSCKTEEVYFNVTEPAPVTVPPYIKKVGIINRSVVSDSNSVRKAIDQVLSVKGSKIDKDCSNECIRGLKDALVQSNTFQNITYLDSLGLKTSYPGAFPPPLSWDQIDQICRQHNVDALFALELFHTDTKVNVGSAAAGIMTGNLNALAGTANVGTTVNTGWRIYDPQNKIILDEFPIQQGLTFNGGGPTDAVSALMNHKEAVMGTSYNIGQGYASRILPYVIRVCREFYIKGNINFRIARRMADAGDWNNAADLWNKETNNPRPKLQARACYDMAIISEMNGNIDGAISWAQKAYEIGGRRLALFYLNILRDRKAQDDLLKAQAHGQ